MRLIDENKAYEVLTDFYHHKTEVQHLALEAALGMVPTAKPKSGCWIRKNGYIYCSNCNDAWSRYQDIAKYFQYCPSCGAKMLNMETHQKGTRNECNKS